MSESDISAPMPPEPPPAAHPEPLPEAEPVATERPPRRRRGGALRTLLATLLFLILFGAVAWLWDQQQQLTAMYAAQPTVSPDQIAALQQRIDGLAQQVTELRRRPLPKPAAAAPPPVDLGPLEARLAALEQRQTPPAPDLAPLEQKLSSVAAQTEAAKGAEADVTSKLGALTQRLAAAEQQAQALAGKATAAQRIEQAQVALDAGEPLGNIPGAPAALARYAQQKPPTEAALRLSFPAAAAAAEHASAPSTVGKSLGERMWLRAKALVTVKQGDRVVVGAPAAEVLGAAQEKLDAGDLAGAIKALDGLDGPAAQAMAPWRQQAQALLDARGALTQMARS